MEHLSLEIFDLDGLGSKYATLPEDTTITITDTSEIFAGGDVWSHSFRLNIRANAHIFGTAGEMHGSRLHEQINRRRARLWVDGLPLYLGYLRLDDEVEVDKEGNIDVSFESGQKTFEEMIEGAKANQVPMMDDVMFGVALWRKRRVSYDIKLDASADFENGKSSSPGEYYQPGISVSISNDGDEPEQALQEYPRMVFPKGEFRNLSTGITEAINCLNTDSPYTEDDDGTPTNPYCNVTLCYQRYGYQKKNEKDELIDDYSGEPEAQRGYEVMPANRVNSAPNFFVIYWIRSLMKHLGIHVEENQMMGVEDLRRLFFVNTNCAYKVPKRIASGNYDTRFERYKFSSAGRLVAEHLNPFDLVKVSECKFKCTGFTVGEPSYDHAYLAPMDIPAIESVNINVTGIQPWTDEQKASYEEDNSFLHDAFATSECFPDVDITEVIKALESGFGIRFLFDNNYRRVRIVLLRNIFRSEEVQEIKCDVISDVKVENSIRGFRMTYGNTEDTHFYYKGFNDMLPHKPVIWPDNSDTHDYSQWDLNADYGDIIHKASAFNKTCYVTPETGNAYGVKVDKDAKRYEELHPSIFEYAGFMDAEDGDCTGEEETIETIDVGFVPAIMNDLNMEAEQRGVSEQHFALFVEETMRPRRPNLSDGRDYNDADAVYDVDGVLYNGDKFPAGRSMMADNGVVKPGEFAITSDMRSTKDGLSLNIRHVVKKMISKFGDLDELEEVDCLVSWPITGLKIDGHINEGYRLYLQDNFEPNDDGISPIETHDWGLTLGIMRGSGSDARVKYWADPQDGEGNDTWEIQPGSSVTAHPDVCDCYGKLWDYDGSVVIRTPEEASAKLAEMFTGGNAPLNDTTKGYINGYTIFTLTDSTGVRHNVLIVTSYSKAGQTMISHNRQFYYDMLNGHSTEEIMQLDREGNAFASNLIVEIDSSWERGQTLVTLCKRAFGSGRTIPIVIDNGSGSSLGRLSLKLRAEKPNPYYDPDSSDSGEQSRYLEITNPSLRGRGLADTMYKEYSYWVRNARIARRTVPMELAQLLTIDKTVRVTVGDITGFIRKYQFSVSNESGLGMVTMEIMYI